MLCLSNLSSTPYISSLSLHDALPISVPVAGVARQLRQHHDARIEDAALLGRLGAALLDLLEDVREHVAQEDRQNRRRRSEEHTSELQSRLHLVCRLLLEKKK